MTPQKTTAMRHLALAQLLLACQAPSSLDEAEQHAQEAVQALQELRRAQHVAAHSTSPAPAGTDASKATGSRIDTSGARHFEGRG